MKLRGCFLVFLVLVSSICISDFVTLNTKALSSNEVAVNNVSVWIHEGLGEIPEGLKMAPVYHCVDTWFYTNVPQNITFEIELIDLNTSMVVARENYTVHLHKGFQKVREFIPVNVSDFTTCQVECKIVKYQYDTNPYNNYAIGNIVTFRPYIDIYTTIVWEPLKQKTEYGLLPGDTVKICVALHVPKNAHVPDIHLKYNVMSNEVGKHRMKMVTARSYSVNSAGGISTIWYNYTMQLPWTNKVVVTANATCPYDLAPENNNASTVIPLSPDAALVSARVQSLAVSSGSVVPVRITVKSNYINTTGGVFIVDETDGNNTIGSASFNITAPLQTVVVNVHVPKINKYSETHTWMVYVTEFNDAYPKDGVKELKVKIINEKARNLLSLQYLPWMVIGLLVIVTFFIAFIMMHRR